MEIDTPHGTARARIDEPDAAARALLVLGHGAGGGIDAPDLRIATRVALARGIAVARIEQPYRVAGRRSAAPAKQLDAAWLAVCAALPFDVPIVTGGRSSGARVACRTAGAVGAAGVLCLAFPLLPPQRKGSAKEPVSRQPELDGAGVPVLVVQGVNDRFGMPGPGPQREVAQVEGDHGLKRDADAIAAAIDGWLGVLVA